MPHFQVHAPEAALADGSEVQIIAGLTEAVVSVFGEAAREMVVVEILGVPAGRWGVAGAPDDDAAPVISLLMREVAYQRPDVPDAPQKLIAAVADQLEQAFGARYRERLTTIIGGVPAGRSGVAGVAA